MPNSQRWVALAVGLLAAFFLVGLTWLDSSSGYAGLSPRFLPTIVGAGFAVCAIALWFARGAVAVPDAVSARWGLAKWLLIGMVGHLVSIGWVGMVFASGWLMACVARAYGSQRFLRDLLIGFLMAGLVWLIFTQGLGLNLQFLPLLKLVAG